MMEMTSTTDHLRIRAAVCIVEGDQILLVEHTKANRRYWLLPGGGVEKGESLTDAARREVVEETGFEANVGQLLLICESIEPEGRHVVNMVFKGDKTGGSLQVGRDDTLSDARWFPLKDIAEITLFPPIAHEILECHAEQWNGPVRFLGNTWTAP